MSLKSWECGKCTWIGPRPGYDGMYCLAAVKNGGIRTEWDGDYVYCLDQTFEPKQMEIVWDESKTGV